MKVVCCKVDICKFIKKITINLQYIVYASPVCLRPQRPDFLTPITNIAVLNTTTTGDCHADVGAPDSHHHYLINMTTVIPTQESGVLKMYRLCNDASDMKQVSIPGKSTCPPGEYLTYYVFNNQYSGPPVTTSELEGTLELIAECTYSLPFGSQPGSIDFNVDGNAQNKLCTHSYSVTSGFCNTFQATAVQLPPESSDAYYHCADGIKHPIVVDTTYSCPSGESMVIVLDGANWDENDHGWLRGLIVLVTAPPTPSQSPAPTWYETAAPYVYTAGATIVALTTVFVIKNVLNAVDCVKYSSLLANLCSIQLLNQSQKKLICDYYITINSAT